MHQLPVIAVALNSCMLAADGLERLVEAHLARGITTQLNLIDNDLLGFACLMVLGAGLVLQHVVSSTRAIENSSHTSSHGAGNCAFVIGLCIHKIKN